MADTPEKITIRREDLADAHVDEVLSQQLSFGMASATPRIEDRPTSLIYRPWFALALAGAFGAFLGWGALEPFFDDFISFRGNLQDVDIDVSAAGGAGYLLVSENYVWFAGGVTRVIREGEVVSPLDLEVGQVVVVRGEPFEWEDGQGLAAVEVEIFPDDSGTYPRASVSRLIARSVVVGLAVFPIIAGLVGLFVGAADGILSRAWRRAALSGLTGLGVGLAVGLVTGLVAAVFYGAGTALVRHVDAGEQGMSTGGFLGQMMVRGLAWAVAGCAMGLGQGIALRSRKLLLNGLAGGVVGALLGGLLFDPIDFFLTDRGTAPRGAELPRAVGFVLIGASTGFMIGLVDLLAREAWVKMLTGPLAGKEFVLYRDPTTVGSSPKSDIYLFKDPDVEPCHAWIRTAGEGYEIEDRGSASGIRVNGVPVKHRRLGDRDQVAIGKTVFDFRMKEG